MAQNEKISKVSRLARALDLKTRGLTDSEISARMTEEGYRRVSMHTVNRLLNGVEAKLFVDELLRLQLRDITISDTHLRLKYRDKILEKLMPRRVEQMVDGSSEIRVVVEDGDDQLENPPRPETGLEE